MKFIRGLNKLTLIVFSVIVLLAGVLINLIAAGWFDWKLVSSLIGQALSTPPISQIILVATEIFMICAILAIFIDTEKKEKVSGRDVLMENDNGKLMISRETIQNIVEVAIKKFAGVKQAQTNIQLDSENNVLVLVDLTVTKDITIKELTVNIQNKVKEAIKRISDLEVKEVNVRIKNIIELENKNIEVGKEP